MYDKSVMVTGAAGYIGTNVVQTLIDRGMTVIPVDLKYGSDINELSIKRIGNQIIPDYIVHLAATSTIDECEKDPIKTIENNIQGTNSVIKYAEEHDIPVIFASSQAVHSLNNLYAYSKFINEISFVNSDISYLALRFSNVYGGIKGLEQPGVISKFLRKYRMLETLKVYGDGNQKRDFIHVYDICEFIRIVIEDIDIQDLLDEISYYEDKEFPIHKIELGTGVQYSINDIVNMFPYDVKTIYDEGPVGVPDCPLVWENDINGWKPEDTLKYYIKNNASYGNPYSDI